MQATTENVVAQLWICHVPLYHEHDIRWLAITGWLHLAGPLNRLISAPGPTMPVGAATEGSLLGGACLTTRRQVRPSRGPALLPSLSTRCLYGVLGEALCRRHIPGREGDVGGMTTSAATSLTQPGIPSAGNAMAP